MKNLLAKLLLRRAEARLQRRQQEIAISIEYSEEQIRLHRERIGELYVEKGCLDADMLTLCLAARRTGGPLARLGVPCCGELR